MTDTALANDNRQLASVLFIHAQTGLHPGGGTALGVVDLPVQRERHTRWPMIAGSAMKGVLRDACREKIKGNYDGDRKRANEADPKLTAVFGPGAVDESSDHAGALAISDARVLAFPVRSLKGVFAWVTCPSVLERFGRDLALAKISKDWQIPEISDTTETPQALVVRDSGNDGDNSHHPLVLDNTDRLVFEEFDFQVAPGSAQPVAKWISECALTDPPTAKRFQQRLVVISDDMFTYFVQFNTEVTARIGLDYDKKTVKRGALFYQEFLPPETILYSLLLAHPGRKPNSNGNGVMSAPQILDYVQEHTPAVLQIGSDETTGKGLCRIAFFTGNPDATT